MSLHQSFDNRVKSVQVLSTRDVLLRLAVGELTEGEVAQLERDILRFEMTGIASARILKVLAAAKPEK